MAQKLTSEELEHKVSVLEQEIQELRSKKEALSGFEEKYRLIVDNAITPIIYFDLDGRVQLVNSVSAKTLAGQRMISSGSPYWKFFLISLKKPWKGFKK